MKVNFEHNKLNFSTMSYNKSILNYLYAYTLRYIKRTAKECQGNVKYRNMYCTQREKWYAYQKCNTHQTHKPFNY